MSPIRTIVHPTDFSESAEAAFSVATVLARQHGARIVVAHVYPPPICHGEVVARRQDGNYEADLWHLLARYSAPDPATTVVYRLIEGGAADEIVNLADEENGDLIVMGTHGWTGVARLLMGSVAEEVSHRAKCPVLTVRIPTCGQLPREEKVKEAMKV